MLTKQKQKHYINARSATGCSVRDWARLFNLGTVKGQHHVVTKEKGTRGVNLPEVLASQLLLFLSQQGFDVSNITFDKEGNINHIPYSKQLSTVSPYGFSVKNMLAQLNKCDPNALIEVRGTINDDYIIRSDIAIDNVDKNLVVIDI